MTDQFIERRIITGLVVSTDYTRQIRKVWNPRLIESKTAKRLASWCIDYFDRYDKAPGRDVESLFFKHTKNLSTQEAQDIEEILDGLSDEFEREEKFNVDYLLDQTHAYLDERNLQEFTDDIKEAVDRGDLTEAKNIASEYNPVALKAGTDIDFSDPSILEVVERTFNETREPIITYPRQIGQFWNDQLLRGGFIALMGPEKRGKSFWLLDLAIRAARQKCKVAFFQAGDMSLEDQVERISTYLTKKSNLEEYSGKMFQPVRDCVYNQMDTCDREERECDHGVFPLTDKENEEIKKKSIRSEEVTRDDLIKAYKENPDYKPCHNCPLYWQKKYKMGAVWLTEVDSGDPLTVYEAKEAVEKFFINKNRRFKFAPYPNDTLTNNEIKTKLSLWEKQDNFVADVVIVDFADNMACDKTDLQKRDETNYVWSNLRGLSLEKHCLVATATWSDANSYSQDRLGKSNFSEDKRKHGHVTAMYGLNQDKDWREKEIGIMRINKIDIRKGDYKETDEVYVLQNLSRGQPCLGSFW